MVSLVKILAETLGEWLLLSPELSGLLPLLVVVWGLAVQAVWAGQVEVSGSLLTHEVVGLLERLGRLPQTGWWPGVVLQVLQQDFVWLGIVMQPSAAQAPLASAGPSPWPLLPLH